MQISKESYSASIRMPSYFGPFAVWAMLKIRFAGQREGECRGNTRGASRKACLRIFRDQPPLEFLARSPVELRSAFSLHLARSAKKLVGRNSHWLIRLGRSFGRGRRGSTEGRAGFAVIFIPSRLFAVLRLVFMVTARRCCQLFAPENFGTILLYFVKKNLAKYNII